MMILTEAVEGVSLQCDHFTRCTGKTGEVVYFIWWQATGGKLEWTIIRPGGLKNDPPTGSGVLTQDTSICGAINREDVADLVVKALFSDNANGKVIDN